MATCENLSELGGAEVKLHRSEHLAITLNARAANMTLELKVGFREFSPTVPAACELA